MASTHASIIRHWAGWDRGLIEPPPTAASLAFRKPRPTHGGFPRRVLSLLHIAGPGFRFGLGFFGRKFVALLGVALELRASAFDNIKILSELAPLGLNLSAEFLPFSFDLIPIHDEFPLIRDCQARGVYAANRPGDIDVDQWPCLLRNRLRWAKAGKTFPPTTFPSSQRFIVVLGSQAPSAASQHYNRRRLLHLVEPAAEFSDDVLCNPI